jgi:hypothetical protein
MNLIFVNEIILILYTIIFYTFSSSVNSFYIESGHHEQISNKTINNFAFGSCFMGRFSTRLDMFKTILENEPDLWVWLGDAAYVDPLTFDYTKSTVEFDKNFAQDLFNRVREEKCIIFMS